MPIHQITSPTPPKKWKVAFKKRMDYLDSFGIKYRLKTEYRGKGEDRAEYFLQLFNSVELPLTPKEWCSIAMSEGENYMGGCCGTMSAVQDKIEYCFRIGSGWIDIGDLAEIFELIKSHGDNYSYYIALKKKGSLDQKVEECRSKWENLNVWDKIALIWFLTKDYYESEVPCPDRDDRPEIYNAIGRMSHTFHRLAITHAFEGDKYIRKEREITNQDHANYLLDLYRVLPDLKMIMEKIKTLDLGPMEGYALVEKEGGTAICSNGYGLCIYKDMTEVKEMFKMWEQTERERKETRNVRYNGKQTVRDFIGVRPVRVTFENGLEFTGDVFDA